MSKQEAIQLFQQQEVRTYWDDEQEKWYFCVNDIIEVLTGTVNPTNYIKQLKHRDTELAKGWLQIVTPLSMETSGGRQMINCTDIEGIFRIIQSIPSKKTEPLKQWLAHVGAQRLNQMQDPELSIEQMVADYHRLGYSDAWINQRVKSIEVRKEFTDEMQRDGITDSKEFAALTSLLTQSWSGKTVKEYKSFKGLKKQNLRDNMTNVELALNTLAEASATEISQQKNPEGFSETKKVVMQGGSVAKAARVQLEKQLGRSVISSQKASDYIRPIEDTTAKPIEE